MNQGVFKDHILACTADLLQLAEINCRNRIPPDLLFILSDQKDWQGINSYERKRMNHSKVPLIIDSAVENLYTELDDLYDVNLYIFRAGKKETIIEIQYCRKSDFDADYFASVKDDPPMFHSKITKPVYAWEGGKFDVNWESGGGLHHVWKSFVWRKFLYRRKIRGKKLR
ncbi:hypothetical protein [Chryseobacterium aureum]|uniref:hypothetical protein n=1 Tax=Chryseobacterium aureum TaxID=2497456 RepID=UPI000F89C02E|nr:hypothetical protein [Chryseobacterium aureum]